jgi:hypothetical protein
MIEHVALDKSSLLLKITLQNTHTLQLFMMNFRTKSIYKSNSKCQDGCFGRERARGLLKEVEECKHLK